MGICHGAIGMLQGPLHWLVDRDKLGRESIWQYQWHPGFTNEVNYRIIWMGIAEKCPGELGEPG